MGSASPLTAAIAAVVSIRQHEQAVSVEAGRALPSWLHERRTRASEYMSRWVPITRKRRAEDERPSAPDALVNIVGSVLALVLDRQHARVRRDARPES
jgi:hypothetical protein